MERISVQETQTLLKEKPITLIDMRHHEAFEDGHITGATHIDALNIEGIVNRVDKDQPLIIYCYHGISSLAAASFFESQGFKEVYSMDGGYEAWLKATD